MRSSSTSSERRYPAVEPRPLASERSAQPVKGPRVLLVDDNEAMLARAKAVLAADCVVVGAVADGPAALQASSTLQPDVIVLDISMPGLSGLDVAFYLRKCGSPAAIVFLTMHEDEEFVLAAKKAGGVGYVVKSRLMLDLLEAVRRAHEGRPFVSPRS